MATSVIFSHFRKKLISARAASFTLHVNFKLESWCESWDQLFTLIFLNQNTVLGFPLAEAQQGSVKNVRWKNYSHKCKPTLTASKFWRDYKCFASWACRYFFDNSKENDFQIYFAEIFTSHYCCHILVKSLSQVFAILRNRQLTQVNSLRDISLASHALISFYYATALDVCLVLSLKAKRDWTASHYKTEIAIVSSYCSVTTPQRWCRTSYQYNACAKLHGKQSMYFQLLIQKS